MAAIDLCTLADVRTLMQKPAGDVAQDTLIGALITRASAKIMRDYAREFVPGGVLGIPSVAAARAFEYRWLDQYPGEAFVDLAPYDLQTTPLPTLSVDTDQAQAFPLGTTEYRLWPQPPAEGVYLAVKIYPLNATSGIVGWRKRQIRVTGTWGFPSIPPEVTHATAATVIYWLSANPSVNRGEGDAGFPIQPRGYPMAALDLLSSFQRMTV